MIKIAITGPESSGKTTLAELLAHEYGATLVEEYAREYLSVHPGSYAEEDLDRMARQQLALEDAAKGRIVILDTDVLVLKIWYEDKYHHLPEFIGRRLRHNTCDLHLLMKPDIPYVEDPLRENPNRRDYFFRLFRENLEALHWPYLIIEGDLTSRVEKAKSAIDQLIHGRFKE